jgi:hypothetical protein
VRLDHLLSKEHRSGSHPIYAEVRDERFLLGSSLVEHWLLNQADRLRVSTASAFGPGSGNARCGVCSWLDTLLGPEETDRWARCGGLAVCYRLMQDRSSVIPVRRAYVCVGCLVAGGVGCCLLFEICIVDASIFVAKFFRAHGGCLGIRSR